MGNFVVSMKAIGSSFGFLGKVVGDSSFGEVEMDDIDNLDKVMKKEPKRVRDAIIASKKNGKKFADLTVNNFANTFGPNIPEAEVSTIRTRRRRAPNGGVGTGSKNTMDIPFVDMIKAEPNKDAEKAQPRDKGRNDRDRREQREKM